MPMFDAAGPGRKQCAGCKGYCGVRSNVCPGCGHVFPKRDPVLRAPPEPVRVRRVVKDDEEVEAEEEVEAVNDSPLRASSKLPRLSYFPPAGGASYHTLVITPAGKAPVELEGTDRATVWRWAHACVETAPEGIAYTVDALAYYARQFYPAHSFQWQEICEHLKNTPGLTS